MKLGTYRKKSKRCSYLNLSLLVLISVFACKDPFSPEVVVRNSGLLVVEGYLHIGGTSTINLSQVGNLQDPRLRIPEVAAKLEVEGNDGSIISTVSDQNGQCVLSTHGLELSKQYRLKITRSNGKIYETEYLESRVTPQIDSINFEIEEQGLTLYANTHDPQNRTRFYSWNFEETWEIRSAVPSFWELKAGKIVEREVSVERCWQSNSSSRILLQSTERLSQDRVTHFPLTYIDGNSIKLSHLYSILVRQYSLTREAFDYLSTLKKNTEDIGTIFDPQPSELKGNFRCVSDPAEPVLGWVSAGTVAETRIFISSDIKPAGWVYREVCDPIMDIHQDSILRYLTKGFLIHRRYTFPLPPPRYVVPAPWKYGDTIFTVAPKICMDCSLKGSTIKPFFWPN